MQVVDVDAVLDGVQAELVGRADDVAPLHAAAGQPHREAVGIVVAAVPFLGHRRAAELAAPDDQRLVEQAALLEVREQAGDRPVGLAAQLAVVAPRSGCGRPTCCPAE